MIELASAGDALRMIRDGMKIDLLVTDFAMPGMNGAQLAAELRKRDPSLTDDDVGGLRRLAKPFRQTELIAQVAEALSSKGT